MTVHSSGRWWFASLSPSWGLIERSRAKWKNSDPTGKSFVVPSHCLDFRRCFIQEAVLTQIFEAVAASACQPARCDDDPVPCGPG